MVLNPFKTTKVSEPKRTKNNAEGCREELAKSLGSPARPARVPGIKVTVVRVLRFRDEVLRFSVQGHRFYRVEFFLTNSRKSFSDQVVSKGFGTVLQDVF